MRVGLVGTGMLGSAVGLCLLNSGFELVAQNRTRAKTHELLRHGANIVSHPRDVADLCELVITCVRDADAVREVSFGRDGLVYGAHRLTVCDMSTINPHSTKEIARRFSEAGSIMLDTPVMGGPDVAIKGELVMMASGDKASFDRYKNVLDVVAGRVFYLGDSGTAHSVKLAMNLQIAMLAMSLSEGIMLCRGASIDPKVFLEILNSTYFKTGMSQNKAYKMIDGKFEPTFLLQNLKKDLKTINESARSLGLSLPMSTLAEATYRRAVDGGFGDLDYTGILAYLESTGPG